MKRSLPMFLFTLLGTAVAGKLGHPWVGAFSFAAAYSGVAVYRRRRQA